MTNKKGKNPFESYQLEVVGSRQAFIENFLATTKPGKYKTPTELAKHIAKMLTYRERETGKLEEGKEVQVSTFLRKSSKYRALIDAYLANRTGTGSITKIQSAEDAVMVINQKNLRIANLEKKVQRLEGIVQHANMRDSSDGLREDTSPDCSRVKLKFQRDTMLLATTIKKLLDHANGLYDINDAGEVVDIAFGEVVVNKQEMKAYHDYFGRNS